MPTNHNNGIVGMKLEPFNISKLTNWISGNPNKSDLLTLLGKVYHGSDKCGSNIKSKDYKECNKIYRQKHYTNLIKFLENTNVNSEYINNEKYESGDTALIMACRYKLGYIANMLIKKGANVNAQNQNGVSALIELCGTPFNTSRSILEPNSASCVYQSNNSNSYDLIHPDGWNAFLKHLVEERHQILNKFANIMSTDHKYCWYKSDYIINYNNITDVALNLINNGANIDNGAFINNTPLLLACENTYADLALALIEKGANVNDEKKNGDTVLLCALNGIGPIMKAWIENDQIDQSTTEKNNFTLLKNMDQANTDDDDDECIIPIILQTNDGSYTDKPLVKYIPIPNISSPNTKLLAHILNTIQMVVLALIEKGVDVNAKSDNGGDSALFTVCSYNLKDVVLALIEKGADVNAKSKNGVSPLEQACFKKHTNVALALIEKGAIFDDTLLIYACQHNLAAIALALIKNGANVNAQTPSIPSATAVSGRSPMPLLQTNGDSVLLLACKNSLIDVALALIENGANVNAKNNDGDTALILVCNNSLITSFDEYGNRCLTSDKFAINPLLYRNVKDNINNKICKPKDINKLLNLVGDLIKKGANVNAQNNKGNSALIIICFKTPSVFADVFQSLTYAFGKDKDKNLIFYNYYNEIKPEDIFRHWSEIILTLISNGADGFIENNENWSARKRILYLRKKYESNVIKDNYSVNNFDNSYLNLLWYKDKDKNIQQINAKFNIIGYTNDIYERLFPTPSTPSGTAEFSRSPTPNVSFNPGSLQNIVKIQPKIVKNKKNNSASSKNNNVGNKEATNNGLFAKITSLLYSSSSDNKDEEENEEENEEEINQLKTIHLPYTEDEKKFVNEKIDQSSEQNHQTRSHKNHSPSDDDGCNKYKNKYLYSNFQKSLLPQINFEGLEKNGFKSWIQPSTFEWTIPNKEGYKYEVLLTYDDFIQRGGSKSVGDNQMSSYKHTGGNRKTKRNENRNGNRKTKRNENRNGNRKTKRNGNRKTKRNGKRAGTVGL